jgi:predicted alpha/beta-hydrolase family hydrolase
MQTENLRFKASESSGDVSAILMRPEHSRWLLLLAHGAGAGIKHPFMEQLALSLAEHKIATLRYMFPYMEQGKRAPNPPPILLKTVRSAVNTASTIAPDLDLLAGGKSLGGRMTSTAAARETLPGVQGIVFFGFPLHAPGKPGRERGDHLFEVKVPMLFLQGSRDKLADLHLLEPLCADIGKNAHLYILADADHSFKVPKRTGKTDHEIFVELAQTVRSWSDMI